MIDRPDALNDALSRMEGVVAFTMEPVFAEHVPMVAETISFLGRNDAVASWVDASIARHRHIPAPPATVPIDGRNEAAWKRALGNGSRMTDWFEFFRRELSERPWRDVVGIWVPRLIDGYVGGLSHGLIRTAHAVRAMPTAEEPGSLLRDELARGLAFWAGSYAKLPGNPDKIGKRPLAQAVRALPRVTSSGQPSGRPAAGRPGGGPPFRFVMPDPAEFIPAVEALEPTTDTGEAISRHTATFAHVLLANAQLAFVPQIQLVHTITSTAALRLLLPYCPPEFGPKAYRRAWQFGASVVARLAPPSPTELEPAFQPSTLSPGELADRAIEHRDDHVIKLTEACLQEDLIRPDPVYRALAEAIQRRIPSWSAGRGPRPH